MGVPFEVEAVASKNNGGVFLEAVVYVYVTLCSHVYSQHYIKKTMSRIRRDLIGTRLPELRRALP